MSFVSFARKSTVRSYPEDTEVMLVPREVWLTCQGFRYVDLTPVVFRAEVGKKGAPEIFVSNAGRQTMEAEEKREHGGPTIWGLLG